MKYLYANFSDSAINYGNLIIDYATRLLLEEYLRLPFDEFDCLKDTVRSDATYDFALIPGCTLLTAGQALGIHSLDKLKIPIYCLAGNIWAPARNRGLLLRTRVLHFRKEHEPDLAIARICEQPVGCRDPYTFEALSKAGIKSVYMGCPTLMLPDSNVTDDGFVLLSFGRDHIRSQVRAGSRLALSKPVIGICHQRRDYDRIRAAGWKLPLVDYYDNLSMYLSYFERASVVVTGRLHGVLPAIAFHKRVFYFGTNDSRTTILDDLGVAIHDYSKISRALDLASDVVNHAVIAEYRKAWCDMLRFITKCSKPASAKEYAKSPADTVAEQV
jgi:hypothetical protein